MKGVKSPVSEVKALKGSRLIDGNGGQFANGVVVVEGTRIKEVGAEGAVRIPAGAEVIDLPGHTLMPGLIDIHVHLMHWNVTSCRNYRVAFGEAPVQLAMLYALHHAQMCLEMGFTTLRDLGKCLPTGESTSEMVAVRDAINNRILQGPRLLVCGRAHITNSHFDMFMPTAAPRAAGWPADGPWELRKMVRSQLRLHCDLIKTVASGGGGTDKEAPDIQNMTQEELDAIVEEAHYFGKPVSCHCFTPEAQKRAVRAGVDTIEHCVWTDDEAIEMIKAAGRYLVPTLAHRHDRAIEVRRSLGTPEFTLQKMKRLQPYTRETFQRLHAAGVKIAMGTDTQVDPVVGENALELEIYVDYGMTPMEAIQTATKNAAEAIWLGDKTGTLEPGKSADVIAVDGNPLDDITLLQKRERIKLVMKEGYVHVDRRPGHKKAVIEDDVWMKWERIC